MSNEKDTRSTIRDDKVAIAGILARKFQDAPLGDPDGIGRALLDLIVSVRANTERNQADKSSE